MKKAERPSMSTEERNELKAWLTSDRDFEFGRKLFYKVAARVYPQEQRYYAFYALFGKVVITDHYREVLAYEMERLMNKEENIKSRVLKL